MKRIAIPLLLALGACAGGPLAMDSELAFGLQDTLAEAEEFSADGDHAVVESVAPLLSTLDRALLWLASEVAVTLPPEIDSALVNGRSGIEGYAPPTPVAPPDPAEMPTDEDWFGLVELILFGAGGGTLASLMRRLLPRDPLPWLADAMTFRGRKKPPEAS